jgi:protein-S-isoprenylcysteine O-methyltransferase Ste14
MLTLALLVRWSVITAALIVVLIGAAGESSVALWLYVGLWSAFILVTSFTVDPDLIRERRRPGPGRQGSLLRAGLFTASIGVSHLIIAGLDVGRLHWSDTVPTGLHVVGFVGLVASFGLFGWATAVNRFFSSVVRIQRDRGHHVVLAGPYRYVRHPGYTATIGFCLCSPLALGSWLSLLPNLVGIGALVWRTVFEDRLLTEELEGYRAYAERVRSRLLPGVWEGVREGLASSRVQPSSRLFRNASPTVDPEQTFR